MALSLGRLPSSLFPSSLVQFGPFVGPSGTHNINDQNCSLLKLVEKLPEASGNFHRVQNILAKSRMFRKHLETSAELGMTLNKFEITKLCIRICCRCRSGSAQLRKINLGLKSTGWLLPPLGQGPTKLSDQKIQNYQIGFVFKNNSRYSGQFRMLTSNNFQDTNFTIYQQRPLLKSMQNPCEVAL